MRSQQYLDGAAMMRKRCIAWLHARAKTMNDPHAEAILNSAAENMGWEIKAPTKEGDTP